ncbi:mitochondrial 50S ribosomal protein L33, putative [Pediculus humanus corporis]|uniref:Mitochondrial 50S ribosomal protein L33, putative n=1 Tax=Pediculus humanus subsp. corporis TaxID=121224 RepID=E0W187_PEDHC|nr:mitochondrial 50S ribosomal protein L33, putative [Pediculus humanus corporis]EEB19393.1 mitochondrial 50S ribosomal protein L33, putative [Pediculus humanus corporis]
MFITNILFKKVKAKNVMVVLQSTGSNHKLISLRERTAGKKEVIRFDPLIDMECVYKEFKKIRSMKRNITLNSDKHEYYHKEPN